jgi:hypothetical protein
MIYSMIHGWCRPWIVVCDADLAATLSILAPINIEVKWLVKVKSNGFWGLILLVIRPTNCKCYGHGPPEMRLRPCFCESKFLHAQNPRLGKSFSHSWSVS